MKNQQTPHKSSPEETVQMIESGNLEINKIVQKGILLLGNTKAGKTTTSLYLTHQNLQGGRNDMKSLVYKSKNVHDKYKVAKIGDIQSVSQTQIPNFLEYTLANKQKICLIDCPGYLDSFGCFRVISNRFFHHQVFSYVKNAKFLITFTYNNMAKKADEMKNTFKEFLKSFQNLDKIKDKVFNATSVMITTVPTEEGLQSVVERFGKTPTNLGSELQSFFIQLKQMLISKNRIFIFHQAEEGKVCDVNNTIIQDINKSTDYWERKQEGNQISMQNIKISINQYVGQDVKQFEKQEKDLQNYYKTKIENDIKNFVDILIHLSKDNQGVDDSSSFINKIFDYVKAKQKERKDLKNKVVEDLFTRYEPKRKVYREKIFSKQNSSETISYQDAPFWFLRLKTQKSIEKEINKVAFSDERSVQSMKIYFEAIKNILDDILWLVKAKKGKNTAQQKKKNDEALQFAYQVYKLVDISNKLYNLVIKSIPDSTKKNENIERIEKGMSFILVQYPSKIKSLFLKVIDVSYQNIVTKNLSKYKFEGFSSKGYQFAAKFIEQVQSEIQSEQTQKDKQEYETTQSVFSNLIVKIKNLGFQKVDLKSNLKLDTSSKIIQQMINNHKNTLTMIRQNEAKGINTEINKLQNNKNILLIGEILQKNNKFELALELYDQIYEAHKVFEILNILEDRTRKQKKDDTQLMDHLRNYMFKAAKYGHSHVALTKGQQALSIALKNSKLQPRNEIGNFIKRVKFNEVETTKQYFDYISSSSNNQIQLPKDLIDRILKESTSLPSPTKK